jgi:hypothetical protein
LTNVAAVLVESKKSAKLSGKDLSNAHGIEKLRFFG